MAGGRFGTTCHSQASISNVLLELFWTDRQREACNAAHLCQFPEAVGYGCSGKDARHQQISAVVNHFIY